MTSPERRALMRMPKASRHFLGILWFSLLLVGCMTQLNLTRPPVAGGDGPNVAFVKPVLAGEGTWARSADGTTKVGVRLQLNGNGAGLPFRIAKADLSSIGYIEAKITATDITPAILPFEGNTLGQVAVTGGIFTPLTFPTVPAGSKRILTIQGFSGGNPVQGALIKTVFDNADSTGTFGISFRTTPAALVAAGLAGGAATVPATTLHAMADALTGATATPGQYTQCHPSRIDISQLITDLNANSGNTAAIIASAATYRQPGANLNFNFALTQSPAAGDMPQLFSTDPATEVLNLGVAAPNGAPGTYTSTLGTVTAVIDATRHVTVTFSQVPAGTWKTGAFLPGDDVNTPNANYYTFGPGRAGQAVGVTVAPAAASGAVTLSPFSGATAAAVEPKYAVGEIRWLKSSVYPGRKVQELSASLPGVLSGMALTDSNDFTVHVGNNGSPYTFASSVNLGGAVHVQLAGAPTIAEANRPRLIFAGTPTVVLDSANDRVQHLRLSGARVMMMGGMLQQATVDGARIPSGIGGAVTVLSGACTVANVHVYDARHMAGTPVGSDKLSGIYVNGGMTQVIDCLVDDNATNSGSTSLRFDSNGGAGEISGILVNSGSNTLVSGCSVIAPGRTTGSGVTAANRVAGITTTTSGVVVQNCTVSNVEANSEATGISVTAGTVANCTVQTIGFPVAGNKKITGVAIGDGTTIQPVVAQNNLIQNMGDNTSSGTTVVGMHLNAPNTVAAYARADNNRILANSGVSVAGIYLTPATNGFNSIFEIKDNQIRNNVTRDDTAAFFQGIGSVIPLVSGGTGANKVTIRHNDISNNQTEGTSYGVHLDLPEYNQHLIEGNRINGNMVGTASSGQANNIFYGIFAKSTTPLASPYGYTIKDNLITNNQVVNNPVNAQTMQFIGIQGTDGNVTVRNNRLSGNQFGGQGDDTCSFSLIAVGHDCAVYSNRLFDNVLGGSLSTSAGFTGIQGSQSSGITVVDANIIVESGLGTSTVRRPIAFSGSGGTVKIRHNTVKVGDNRCDGVLISGSTLGAEAVNNAMRSLATTDVGDAFSRGGVGGPNTAGGNYAFGWINLYATFTDSLGGSSATDPGFGASGALVTVGAHDMGLTAPIVGVNGAATIGAQGTYAGVNVLEAAYAY